MVRLNPSTNVPSLNLTLHRFQILLEDVPKFFFSNFKLAMDTVRSSSKVRKSYQVEILDTVTGVSHYSRGRLH